MFNVHYQFAIFEEGSHNRIQYRLHDSLPRRETNLETLPISSNPKKTYRGPHVRSIFPDVDNTGVLNHRVMLVLNVPGLPEVGRQAAYAFNSSVPPEFFHKHYIQ